MSSLCLPAVCRRCNINSFDAHYFKGISGNILVEKKAFNPKTLHPRALNP